MHVRLDRGRVDELVGPVDAAARRRRRIGRDVHVAVDPGPGTPLRRLGVAEDDDQQRDAGGVLGSGGDALVLESDHVAGLDLAGDCPAVADVVPSHCHERASHGATRPPCTPPRPPRPRPASRAQSIVASLTSYGRSGRGESAEDPSPRKTEARCRPSGPAATSAPSESWLADVGGPLAVRGGRGWPLGRLVSVN